MARPKALKKNQIKLSSDIVITLNDLAPQAAQNLALGLTKSQLMKGDGTVINPDDIDSMTDVDRFQLIDGVMRVVKTILLEDDVLEVELPKDKKWLRKLMRKSYVVDDLNNEDIQDVYDDEELQRYLYVRWVAIQGDEDFNSILNASLMNVAVKDEVEESE